jgi:NAD(P)H-dependent flavin oxidoreductase YrpB (nitropropane dioxygenase family)
MAGDPLHTRLCDDFGIDVPVFGFSHCKDVVVELCNAGGVGIFGGLGAPTLDALAEEVTWIRDRVGNKPFGFDLIFPASMPESDVTWGQLLAAAPEEHRQFMRTLKEELKIPDPKPVPGPRPGNQPSTLPLDSAGFNFEDSRRRAEVLIDMKVPIFAAGLGSPGFIIDAMHAHGIKVFSLVGNVRQAKRVAEAGVDYVVAQGYDSAGHTGEIGTFSLIPQVVDAVYPTPVLAAGGIVGGRQLVAAMALGAVGVWTGTVWLPTRESDHLMVQKQALLDANERDTVRTRVYSGKPGRFLRNAFTTAWERDGAPKPLPLPYQVILTLPVVEAAFDYDRVDIMRTEVNQSVGLIKEMKTVRQTVFDFVDEAQEVLDRIGTATI